jgi:hypothetical protein
LNFAQTTIQAKPLVKSVQYFNVKMSIWRLHKLGFY